VLNTVLYQDPSLHRSLGAVAAFRRERSNGERGMATKMDWKVDGRKRGEWQLFKAHGTAVGKLETEGESLERNSHEENSWICPYTVQSLFSYYTLFIARRLETVFIGLFDAKTIFTSSAVGLYMDELNTMHRNIIRIA